MRRRELIRLFVLDAIADDYEDASKIVSDVAILAGKCDIVADRAEVLATLRQLIEEGFAKVYSVGPHNNLQGHDIVPSLPDLERFYYWQTDKGRELQALIIPDWPFDSRGNPVDGWTLD